MDWNERGVARSQVGGTVRAYSLWGPAGEIGKSACFFDEKYGLFFFFRVCEVVAALLDFGDFHGSASMFVEIFCGASEMQSRRKELGKQGLEQSLRCRPMRIVFSLSVAIAISLHCLQSDFFFKKGMRYKMG